MEVVDVEQSLIWSVHVFLIIRSRWSSSTSSIDLLKIRNLKKTFSLEGGGGCGECEAHGVGSDFKHAPDLTVRIYPSQSHWEGKVRNKEKKERAEKVTVA